MKTVNAEEENHLYLINSLRNFNEILPSLKKLHFLEKPKAGGGGGRGGEGGGGGGGGVKTFMVKKHVERIWKDLESSM